MIVGCFVLLLSFGYIWYNIPNEFYILSEYNIVTKKRERRYKHSKEKIERRRKERRQRKKEALLLDI
jgi:TM2 domain-containing membrane protein YozV